MQLFEQEALVFRKIASVELEEDATQWPRQVLTELFRVLPEISDYTPDVRFIRTNEEQGYAVGVIVVTNTTSSALATQQPSAAAPPPPRALIPVVVKNGRLSPLDTLMSSSGKMFPLTADRLREVLYRPESFELVTEDWGDNALWSMFAPPGSQGFGNQGGLGGAPGIGAGAGAGGIQYMMGPGMGGMKQASAAGDEDEPSILDRIAGTVLEPDMAKLASALEQDEALLSAATQNPAMVEALRKLSSMTPVTEKTAEAYEGVLRDLELADVALIRWQGGDHYGYSVKTACRATGAECEMLFDRGEFLRFAGEKVAAAVDASGSAVAAEPAGARIVAGTRSSAAPPVIEHSGKYTVFNRITGASLDGYVYVGLVDGKGRKLPLSLFASDLGSGVQDQIVGESNYNNSAGVAFSPPRGRGCFVVSAGGDHATIELTVSGSVSDGASTRYRCVDLTGEPLEVVLQRGMRGIAAFPERNELVLPFSAGFVSTEAPAPPLVSTPTEAEKTAASLLDGKVIVRADPAAHECYQLELRNLPKLAAQLETRGVAYDDAIYALCFAGLGAADAQRALNKVAHTGRVEIYADDIGSPPTLDTDAALKIASDVLEIRDLHPHLLKEAAALPDTMTVDAVLSLDFINSENVRTYIAMIPHLEKALNKICELTFAARLGLSEIPEAAAARAARGLNDTVRGLKALALRQIEELP